VKYALFVLSILLWAAPAFSEVRSEPQPLPYPQQVELPLDTPYPGTMTLFVDATDLDHRIFRVRQTIPVAGSGPMVLWYPQWIPGTHAAIGPVHDYAGLMIKANGQPVRWMRDPVQVYAYRIDVPANARTLEIEAQFLTPAETAQGPVVMTPDFCDSTGFRRRSIRPGISFAASLSTPA